MTKENEPENTFDKVFYYAENVARSLIREADLQEVLKILKELDRLVEGKHTASILTAIMNFIAEWTVYAAFRDDVSVDPIKHEVTLRIPPVMLSMMIGFLLHEKKCEKDLIGDPQGHA